MCDCVERKTNGLMEHNFYLKEPRTNNGIDRRYLGDIFFSKLKKDKMSFQGEQHTVFVASDTM